MEIKTENFRKQENFPVASLFIPKQARYAILALYKFARGADEIADNFNLPEESRKEKLLEIYNGLKSGSVRQIPYFGRDYFRVCVNGEMNIKHGLALLEAFIQDTEKKRYENWEETLKYCQKSAATIGESVLEATGEFGADVKLSGQICTVLQLINHLQDLKTDYLGDGRVYFDSSFFPEVDAIGRDRENSNITNGKIEIIRRLREMLFSAKDIITTTNNFRVRSEIATICVIAEKLLYKLSHNDILAGRIELTKKEKKLAVAKGLIAALQAYHWSKYSSQKIAYKSGSSFIKPLLRLKKERRKAMLCFYSFCRLIDDNTDNFPVKDVHDLRLRLQQWHDEIEKIYCDDIMVLPNHPISRELALYVKKYSIEKEYLLEIINGQQMDIDGKMIAPSEELLDLYCYRVASCVGLVSVQIFGYDKRNKNLVDEFAVNLGKAMQLINIIRDVKEDAKNGRIYIPKNLLVKNGIPNITPTELFGNYDKIKIELQPVLRKMAEMAGFYFSKAMEVLPQEERNNMRSALLMKKIYQKYLEKMRLKNFIFDKKEISLSFGEKLGVMVGGCS